jgi:hypothetical protein
MSEARWVKGTGWACAFLRWSWVIDCERKLGAVAFERAFARLGDQNQTVQSSGDEKAFADPSIVEVDKLTFGQAATGSMQARFGDALCVMNPDLQ